MKGLLLKSKHVAACLVCVLSFVLTGCEKAKVETPQRNLERPVDMAFFCAGPVDPESEAISALGADLCDTSLVWCESSEEECEETLGKRTLLGLVLNSSRGELGLVNVTRRTLLDLESRQPGFTFVPVGSLPTAVGVTHDGCSAVTLNGGECNASLVDTTGLLDLVGADTIREEESGPLVRHVSFYTDSGRLLARPADLVMTPGPFWPPQAAACSASGSEYSAFVSFPGCGLVAEVNLADGRILQSARVTREGILDMGTDPVCPRECPDYFGDAVQGGSLSEDGPRHFAYRSFAETGRSPVLYIAPDRGDYVAMISLTPEGSFNYAGSRVLELENVRLGIRRIRLSPVSITPDDFQFLYAVTRDGDIRVIDVSGEPEMECETNPDPRDPLFQIQGWRRSYGACIPLDEDVMRAPMFETPGITPPASRKFVDVGFTVVFAEGYDEELDVLDPRRLDGVFAYGVTMDGASYLINVDERFRPAENGDDQDPLDARMADGIHAVISHQIRNSVDTRSTEDGPPRAEEPFKYYRRGSEVRDPPAGVTLDSVIIDDPKIAVSETWTLGYEGILPGGGRSTGYVVKMLDLENNGDTVEFRDTGSKGFCSTGVDVGDRLLIKGCSFDRDCPEGFGCLDNPRTGQTLGGICLDARHVRTETVNDACLPLALGTREYEVIDAYDDLLVLGLTMAPGTSCDTAADCGIEDEPGLSFLCEEGRCAVDCSEVGWDGEPVEDCAVVGGVCLEGRCVNAPLPNAYYEIDGELSWCLPLLVDYEIRAAGVYLAVGSITGAILSRTTDEDMGGMCVDDEEASDLFRFRVFPEPDVFSNPFFSLTLGGTQNADELQRGDSIGFNIVAGFRAMGVNLACRLPAKAVTAPDGNIYVVDMGDDVTMAGGVAGRVVRILGPSIALDPDFLIR